MSEQNWRGQKQAPNAPEAKATPSKNDLVEVPLTMMVGREKRQIGTATYVRFDSEAVHVTVTDPVAKIYLKKRLLDGVSIDPVFKSNC